MKEGCRENLKSKRDRRLREVVCWGKKPRKKTKRKRGSYGPDQRKRKVNGKEKERTLRGFWGVRKRKG